MKILSVKQFSNKLKVTVQATGRLNFTEETTKILGISEDTPVKFGIEDNVLYLAFLKDQDEDAFKVRKSGTYFYIPTKALFDALEIDYKRNTTLSYNLLRAEDKDMEMGGQAFRLAENTKDLSSM